jgi:hypothetical protein
MGGRGVDLGCPSEIWFWNNRKTVCRFKARGKRRIKSRVALKFRIKILDAHIPAHTLDMLNLSIIGLFKISGAENSTRRHTMRIGMSWANGKTSETKQLP